MPTATEKREIELAKKRFNKNKRIVTIADNQAIPRNALGEKATGLRIVETLADGRIVVVPEYPSDNWY